MKMGLARSETGQSGYSQGSGRKPSAGFWAWGRFVTCLPGDRTAYRSFSVLVERGRPLARLSDDLVDFCDHVVQVERFSEEVGCAKGHHVAKAIFVSLNAGHDDHRNVPRAGL